ncbi:ATP synthase subunit I [Tropicimonas sp. IMCC6043]|uniref:N-ATPase subunit AtpR n=1 Tax=Tropicimonas sp. IMCC6043 TaxID=2510645 RepID=UPI0013EA2CBA|nr:ATP synthase subunit I [Tropicimonas sp. IMCC6043]
MTHSFVIAALGLAFGLALGIFHFATLRRVTALYLGDAPARAVTLQILRLALLACLMVALALLGAPALVTGALGVVLGREIVLRQARKDE